MFLNENVWIPIKISLKFIIKGPINNIPALVQIMAWCRSGDKPLSEPMMVRLPTHICVARPQWVKEWVEHPCKVEEIEFKRQHCPKDWYDKKNSINTSFQDNLNDTYCLIYQWQMLSHCLLLHCAILSPGVPHALRYRIILRPRRSSILRDPLPRAARLPLCRLSEAHHGALHHCHVQEISPRTFCVCLLS